MFRTNCSFQVLILQPYLFVKKLWKLLSFFYDAIKKEEKIKSSPSHILLGWVWRIGKNIKIIWNGTSSQGANIPSIIFWSLKKFSKEFFTMKISIWFTQVFNFASAFPLYLSMPKNFHIKDTLIALFDAKKSSSPRY